MHTQKQRGILFLAFGFLFTAVFLIGGGVLTSNNGSYWTFLFLMAFAVALVFPGRLVYRSAKSQPLSCIAATSGKIPWPLFLMVFLAVGMIPLWLWFFRSDFFTTGAGQHLFIILMGMGLAQFLPLGLGFWMRSPAPEQPS